MTFITIILIITHVIAAFLVPRAFAVMTSTFTSAVEDSEDVAVDTEIRTEIASIISIPLEHVSAEFPAKVW